MDSIQLKNIKIYAYHGCLVEESKIGSEYLINLSVKANLQKAGSTDKLEDTVDYVALQKIVIDEMAIPSKLLESVCKRIIHSVFSEIKKIKKVKVEVAKINPPLGGDVEAVSVRMKAKR